MHVFELCESQINYPIISMHRILLNSKIQYLQSERENKQKTTPILSNAVCFITLMIRCYFDCLQFVFANKAKNESHRLEYHRFIFL